MTGALANQLVALLLVAAVGFVCRRRGLLTPPLNRGLSELLLKVVFPCLIVSQFARTRYSAAVMTNMVDILVLALAIHVGAFLLSLVIFWRHPPEVRRVLQFQTVFSNCATLGIPVVASFYGGAGILYASVYFGVYNACVWTLGVLIFTTGEGIRWRVACRSLLNAGVVSVLVGSTLFVSSAQLPGPISGAIDTIATMSVPLAVLRMGSYLAEVKPLEVVSDWHVYYGSLVRLLVVPLVAFGVMRLVAWDIDHEVVASCALLAAMPSGLNTPVMAEIYGGDVALAVRSVAVSTVLSALTIPLMLLVAR